MTFAVEFSKADDSADVLLGLVEVRGAVVGASPPDLDARVAEVAATAKAWSDTDTDAVRGAVRRMLRHGRYKPTGRAKPASEYLLGAAREQRLGSINNLVDINNLVSLEFLLPISIIDLERGAPAQSERAAEFVLRRGRQAESYVFNDAGQSIDLSDLLLVARMPGDAPCANPVKDSMATKVMPATRNALGIIYAPRSLEARLGQALMVFGDALGRWSGSTQVVARIV